MSLYTARELLIKNSHYAQAIASMEGDIDGRLHTEIEFTFYVKMTDLSVLDKAIRKEEHEQWNLPIKTSIDGRARLRLVDGRRPTMTTKVQRKGMLGWEEVDADIPMDLYNHLREMSVNGYRKTRYTFQTLVPGLYWEIDVFRDKMGQRHPWVKVDLEVEDINAAIPKFPFDIEGMIQADDDNLSKSDRNFIDDLWRNEWCRLDSSTEIAETGVGISDLGKKETVLE